MAKVELTADIDVELSRRVEIAAVSQHRSVSEWLADAIRHELERDEAEDRSISRASVPAFQRDWDSEEDAVYDELAG